jgi:hypothetical protein
MTRAPRRSDKTRKGDAAGPDPQRRRVALRAAHLRYGGLSSTGKKSLVDELVVLTGYHRKSVLRALNRTPAAVDPEASVETTQRHHRCRYGPEVMEALVPLWEASDRL